MPDTINLDIDYFDHPKVRRLIGILGPGSEVHHIRLMTYTAKHRPGSGGFDDWSAEEIESAADWRGEKSKMVEAMIRCGLLHEKNGGYYLHDWKERQPHLVKYEKTKRERKKAADKRWNQERRRKNGRNPKAVKEKGPDANDDAKRDFASPENEFCITKAVQGNAVTTLSLSPAHVRDGDQEDEGALESAPPGDDMPDSLIRVGEAVISPMPVHQLRILVLDGFPVAWIEKALLEAGRREIKGKRAVDYARKILQEWTKQGGLSDDSAPGKGASRSNAAKTGSREKPDYSDVETGALL